ncbi:MAG: thioredoxin domain-containing protein [Chitinispirillaceae bacterium]
MKTVPRRNVQMLLILLIVSLLPQNLLAKPAGSQKKNSQVKIIGSSEQFNSVIEKSGDKLLMFDLYADWCMPCRILSPMLEKIAADMNNSVTVYKINIDKHPELASMFQVSGIPFVVLVKEKKVVQALTGVQPEATYRRAIINHSDSYNETKREKPHGKLINGKRVINLTNTTTLGDLYVYRGEEVRLVFEKVKHPFSVHIPELKASGSAAAEENLEIEFKAGKSGVYSMMCNGQCPTGDGQQFARVVVLEYEVDSAKAVFRNVSAGEAHDMLKKRKPLLLDVRTPGEFSGGHIKDAKLLPLQQLSKRIGEMKKYKDRPIVVYCRSGNRSIPASQILIQNGFKEVYNVESGIRGWIKESFSVEKP